jgi:hypothetical protein
MMEIYQNIIILSGYPSVSVRTCGRLTNDWMHRAVSWLFFALSVIRWLMFIQILDLVIGLSKQRMGMISEVRLLFLI